MSWTVTTWNLHGSADPDLEDIAEVLRQIEPDALALQEVRRTQARRLGALLGMRVAWRRKHYPYSPLVWWRAEGHAIVTPHQIGDVRRDTVSTGEPVWIYRRRIMLSAVIRRAGESLAVHDLHLSSDDADDRILQARRAAAAARLIDADLRVVCGDLNAADEPEVVREFHTLGVRDPGGMNTSPARTPRQRIDYVLVPDPTRAHVVTPAGGDDWARRSDHLPVTVRF